MDWNTILTSGVIAAFITGLITLISNYSNHKNDSKIKYVTEERKNWRIEIREICEKLNIANSKDDVMSQLIKLKVKINAFGNTDIYDEYYKKYNDCKYCDKTVDQNDHNKKKLFSKNKTNSKSDTNVFIQLTKYFRNDGHIWKQIHKIEAKDKFEKNDISVLIEYLSYLLKYDWERSKSEVLINMQVLYARFVFALSFVFATGYMYKASSSKDKFFDVFSIVMLFIISFIVSTIPKYDLFERIDYDKYKVIGISCIPILIIALMFILIDLGVLANALINKPNDNFYIILPLLLLIIAIALNCGAVVKNISLDEQYRDLLLSYNRLNINVTSKNN